MAADSMTVGPADAADRRGAQDVLPVPGHPAGPDRDRPAHSEDRGRRGRHRRRGGAHARWSRASSRPRSTTGTGELEARSEPSAGCRLRHGHPANAGALLSHRHAGPGSDGSPGELHVGHGGQRHGVQHGLDVTISTRPTSSPGGSDRHYLWMGRFATFFGTAISIGAAYLASRFNNIMDALQLVFGFVNAPLVRDLLLGMFWKRATGHGAFSRLAGRHGGRGDFPWPELARKAPTPRIKGGWLTARLGLRSALRFPPRWPRTSGWPSSPGRPASW